MSERPIRCAIYTRKSHEEGLEQEYNSLDAQYDASMQYIARQPSWLVLPKRYDDGGFTGGNTDRPALQRLLADIRNGEIDIVVIYKIDRLSRSLLDFLNMLNLFESHRVGFVSVTQHIDSSTPMGKLLVHILLSFAQFEREITSERIRDKVAASKKKGMWMGGCPPLGYDLEDKKLIVNAKEAKIIQMIFEQFVRHGSPTLIVRELADKGCKTKEWTSRSGTSHISKKIDKGMIYKLLRNPVFIGQTRHKDKTYEGQHEAIITLDMWEQTQRQLSANPVQRAAKNRVKLDFILRGLMFDTEGRAMTPSFTRKKSNKLYRYYVSTKAIKEGYGASTLKSLSADQIEAVVLAQVKEMTLAPEMVFRTYQRAQEKNKKLTECEVQEALAEFNGLWDRLFPIEKNRIIHLLVERIVVGVDSVNITYHANGLLALCDELRSFRRAA